MLLAWRRTKGTLAVISRMGADGEEGELLMEEAVCSALPELRHRARGCHLEDEEAGAPRVRLETDGEVGMPARLPDPADSILASCPVDLLRAAAAAAHDQSVQRLQCQPRGDSRA